MLPTSAMYYCYIGGPASGTSVPLGPPLYPNVINLLLRKLFMHLCQCFLCYFLPWEQLKAYVIVIIVIMNPYVPPISLSNGQPTRHKLLIIRDGEVHHHPSNLVDYNDHEILFYV